MPTLLLSHLMAAFLAASPRGEATPEQAYAHLKQQSIDLRNDAKRNKIRSNWQRIIKQFESFAEKNPKHVRAPDAHFMAAELSIDLSQRSMRTEDFGVAKQNYQKVISTWPKNRLADDSAFALANILVRRDKQPAAARRTIELALPYANDRRKELQVLLATLPAERAKVARPIAHVAAPAKIKGKAESAAQEVVRVKASREVVESPMAAALRKAVGPLRGTNEGDSMAVAPPVDEMRDPIPLMSELPADEIDEPVAEGEPTTTGDEVVEGTSRNPLVALQESLRDVRVGQRAPQLEDVDARSRFRKLARVEESAEVSLAQQLGLKVRRVIIDAGHGGHDTGAIGPKGTYEKDAALGIAKKVAARLQAQGLEVILTRDDDSYVKLEERTRIANRSKGDLFISIHCNAAPSRAQRGIETYTLNTSSDRYSIRLAARENSASERGVGDLQFILADLATKANTTESSQLANYVQRSLVRNLSREYKNVKDLGTKEALFFVLLGAKMPAILIETAFISNAEEEERLKSGDFQRDVAESIAGGIDLFLNARNKVARVE